MERRRDTSAFCEFVEARSHALLRTTYLMVGDHQLAQDLLQEALIKTLLAWPRLRDPAKVDAYARRTVVTTAITWRRRRSWRPLAAALLLVATGCTSAGTGTTEDDAGTPASSTSADAETSIGTPTPQDPVLSPGPGEVIELDQHGPEYVFTKAGRYAVRLTPHLSYEVDAPDMWEVLNGRYFSSSDFSGGHGIFLIAAAQPGKTWLPTHPCLDRTRVPVGPSVRDLAEALRAQPALDVTRPAEVTIGNKSGLHIRITAADRVVPSGCVGGDVALYSTTPSGDDWWTLYGGAEARILDVDGERWVILTNCDETCSRADLARLTKMAGSVTFTRD